MAEYKVVEKFVSINGEGMKAGTLAVFIRFFGCNLRCSYCDTLWASSPDGPYDIMTEDDIVTYVKETGVHNVTLTGGEPLLRDNMDILLKKLSALPDIFIEIETNGSVDIRSYKSIAGNISFTLDYKLPYSGMEDKMFMPDFEAVDKNDTVKFVAAGKDDLDTMKEIVEKYNLANKTNVFISPVFGEIEPVTIVEYMIDNKLNSVKMQLQMHKFIWDPNQKGV